MAVGRAVEPVTTIAHQLHGAIGVTREHQLWLATMRARSWVDDFGSTAHHARRLGRMALASDDPGTSSSAVQHLVDAGLDVAEAGDVDAELVGQRLDDLRRRVVADSFALALAVDGEVAPA